MIAAEGEHKASRALRHAAEVIAGSPAALQVIDGEHDDQDDDQDDDGQDNDDRTKMKMNQIKYQISNIDKDDQNDDCVNDFATIFFPMYTLYSQGSSTNLH